MKKITEKKEHDELLQALKTESSVHKTCYASIFEGKIQEN
jgi:hypothetical protein